MGWQSACMGVTLVGLALFERPFLAGVAFIETLAFLVGIESPVGMDGIPGRKVCSLGVETSWEGLALHANAFFSRETCWMFV